MARITVKVHPRARRTAVTGTPRRGVEARSGGAAGGRQGERRVRARFSPNWRAFAKSRVRIVSGATGRMKLVEIEGVEQAALEAQMAAAH